MLRILGPAQTADERYYIRHQSNSMHHLLHQTIYYYNKTWDFTGAFDPQINTSSRVFAGAYIVWDHSLNDIQKKRRKSGHRKSPSKRTAKLSLTHLENKILRRNAVSVRVVAREILAI